MKSSTAAAAGGSSKTRAVFAFLHHLGFGSQLLMRNNDPDDFEEYHSSAARNWFKPKVQLQSPLLVVNGATLQATVLKINEEDLAKAAAMSLVTMSAPTSMCARWLRGCARRPAPLPMSVAPRHTVARAFWERDPAWADKELVRVLFLMTETFLTSKSDRRKMRKFIHKNFTIPVFAGDEAQAGGFFRRIFSSKSCERPTAEGSTGVLQPHRQHLFRSRYEPVVFAPSVRRRRCKQMSVKAYNRLCIRHVEKEISELKALHKSLFRVKGRAFAPASESGPTGVCAAANAIKKKLKGILTSLDNDLLYYADIRNMDDLLVIFSNFKKWYPGWETMNSYKMELCLLGYYYKMVYYNKGYMIWSKRNTSRSRKRRMIGSRSAARRRWSCMCLDLNSLLIMLGAPASSSCLIDQSWTGLGSSDGIKGGLPPTPTSPRDSLSNCLFLKILSKYYNIIPDRNGTGMAPSRSLAELLKNTHMHNDLLMEGGEGVPTSLRRKSSTELSCYSHLYSSLNHLGDSPTSNQMFF